MASPRFIQPSGAGRDYLAVTIGAYIREPVRCCSLDSDVQLRLRAAIAREKRYGGGAIG